MSAYLDLLNAEDIARCCPPLEDSGLGALKTDRGNLPLKLMDVDAHISGLLSQVRLRQTFVNTLGVPLEATYIFPLPSRAAVSAFRFQIGERIVEGTLQERGEARRQYDQAIATGHRAAITEEERPGVFTMRVGNLMPGEEVSVTLTLCGPLPYSDGEATFRFPLVVAPRYIPGSPLGGEQVGDGTAHDTDAVPDASRISPPVLLPGFPNPIRLSLSVTLDPAGLPLGAIRSSLHSVTASQHDGVHSIRLLPGERLDKDFIVRFALAGERLGSSLQICPDADGEGGGTFQLTVVPPLGKARTVEPRDIVFVIDRSGSMGGWKMIAARRATARMLDTLTDHDRFSVLAFDTRIDTPDHQVSGQLLAATDRNRFRAVEFLAGLEARGGTEMARPLGRAVDELLADEDAGRDRIVVLITDGQVGNEDQILRTLGSKLERVRVFTLGIDRAVNAAFLKRLAEMGGGYCELVESEDRLDEVMDKVHRRIGTPLLTHLELEDGIKRTGLKIDRDSLVPRRLPDMFAGTPLRISGRFRSKPSKAISLRLRASDGVGCPFEETTRGVVTNNPALTAIWARGRIRSLEDRLQTLSGRKRGKIVEEITRTSLRFNVLCRFTAFVAVDLAEIVNAGGNLHQVTQAVESPDRSNEKASAPLRRQSQFPPQPANAPPPPSCTPLGDPFAAPAGAVFGAADSFAAGPSPAAKGGGGRAGGGQLQDCSLSSMPRSPRKAGKKAKSTPKPPRKNEGLEDCMRADNLEDCEIMSAATPVIKLLNLILLEAIKDQATEIHLEPFETTVQVRRRIGGELLELRPPFPPHLFRSVCSRIKVMAGMSISQTGLPQDGRIELDLSGRRVVIRVSTLPVGYGEAIVMLIEDAGKVAAKTQTWLPAAYRRRLDELLDVLKVAEQGAVEGRLRETLRLATLLETLIEDLRSVGTEVALLQPLEALLADLIRVLRPGLGANDLTVILGGARVVLEAYQAGRPPVSASASKPGRRKEGFWL